MRIRQLGFVLFLLFISFPVMAGQEPAVVSGRDLFAQAVVKYQAGDYASSIALNEKVINDAGVESAAVYFNLGNSYFKSGQLGRAMINYLRAERISPRDGDIRANLVFARQAVEQVESSTTVPVNSRWFAVFSSLSSVEFKWAALIAFMLTGVVCLWGLYARLPSKRVWLWTGLSFVFSGYILIAFCVHFVDTQDRAVVLTKTEARFEPSIVATVYFKVPEGAEIKVLRGKEGWVKIQRQDGRSGWVLESTVGDI